METTKIESPLQAEIVACPIATTNPKCVVAGSVHYTGKSTLHLYVNGKEHKIASSKWLATMTLDAGYNDLEFLINDEDGLSVTLNRTIFCGIMPPELTVNDLPLVTHSKTITLSGTARDLNQLKAPFISFTVNKAPVHLEEDGTWTFETSLKEGVNNFDISLVGQTVVPIKAKKMVAYHPKAPEISFQNLPDISPTNTLSFSAVMKNFNPKTSDIKINDKIVAVKDNGFTYMLNLRREITTITFAVVVENKTVLNFPINIGFEPGKPKIKIEQFNKISSLHYRLSGTVSDANDNDPTITIDGREVVPKKGQWSFSVVLKYGDNQVVLKAKNAFGKQTEVIRKLFVPVPDPIIKLNAYPESSETDSVTISGLVTDELNEDCMIFINKVQVPSITGRFSYTLTLTEGKNEFQILAMTKSKRYVQKNISVVYTG